MKLSNSIAEQKQQSNSHTQGDLLVSKTDCLGAWGTEPNSAQQVWYVGIQDEYYLECFKSYDIYMKIK